MYKRGAALFAILLTLIPGTPAPTPRYLYSTLEGETSSIWSSDGPRLIARVSHLDGFGIRTRLSPNGTHLAYTLLAGSPSPVMLSEAKHLEGGRGELWVLPLSEGSTRLLVVDIDVHSTPVWSSDGTRLTARRGTALLSVEVNTGRATTVLPQSPVEGVYPFAWRPEGLYYAVINGGTNVYRDGEHVLRASDGIARDFRFVDGRLVYDDTFGAQALLPVRTGESARAPDPNLPPNSEFIGWIP